jgi:hypothetical protein
LPREPLPAIICNGPLTPVFLLQLVAKVFPTQQAVNKVVEKAEAYWGEHPNHCIAIHCAYGEAMLVQSKECPIFSAIRS